MQIDKRIRKSVIVLQALFILGIIIAAFYAYNDVDLAYQDYAYSAAVSSTKPLFIISLVIGALTASLVVLVAGNLLDGLIVSATAQTTRKRLSALRNLFGFAIAYSLFAYIAFSVMSGEGHISLVLAEVMIVAISASCMTLITFWMNRIQEAPNTGKVPGKAAATA